jgi:hypothetical protein
LGDQLSHSSDKFEFFISLWDARTPMLGFAKQIQREADRERDLRSCDRNTYQRLKVEREKPGRGHCIMLVLHQMNGCIARNCWKYLGLSQGLSDLSDAQQMVNKRSTCMQLFTKCLLSVY